MKRDGPQIAVASGLAGLLGMFCPVAGGDILDFSYDIMGTTISLEALGFFSASKIVFFPAIAVGISGAVAMMRGSFGRGQAALTLGMALFSALGFLFQKSMIDSLSMVGVTGSLGLFLLLVSTLGAILASILGLLWPTVKSPPKST